MANPKKTSLAALKAALREGKKYAKEANGIKIPIKLVYLQKIMKMS